MIYTEEIFPKETKEKKGKHIGINTFISGFCQTTKQRLSGRVKRINYNADPRNYLYTLDNGRQLYAFEIENYWDV